MASRFLDKEFGVDRSTAIANDTTGTRKVRNLPDAAGIVSDSVDFDIKYNRNGTIVALADLTTAQTLTNKTLTSPTINSLTLTSPTINSAVGVGASEDVITTNVIAAAESGTTYYLDLAAGFTSTLPAPALGLWFRFIVKTAPTGSYVITTNAGANVIYGMFVERAGGAGVAGAAQDTQNFVLNQSKIADWAEYFSDGTNWYVRGMVDVAAGITFAVT